MILNESAQSVITRAYEAADLRALYAIEEVCFEPEVRFSRSLMRSLAVDPKCRIWIGTVDDVRVGFAIVGLHGPREYRGLVDEAAAYVWTIEVLPGYRRMGVARELLGRLEESALEAGCATMELHVAAENGNAQALYAAAGFALESVEAGFYGPGQDGLRYRKQLR